MSNPSKDGNNQAVLASPTTMGSERFPIVITISMEDLDRPRVSGSSSSYAGMTSSSTLTVPVLMVVLISSLGYGRIRTREVASMAACGIAAPIADR